MNPFTRCEGPDDERLTDYRSLRVPERRIRTEQSGNFYIAEGAVTVFRVAQAGAAVRSVVATTTMANRYVDELATIAAPVYVVTQETLNQVVGFNLHRGVVATVQRPAAREARALCADPSVRTILVVEQVNDFENMGSMFRSAAALGADAVLLDPHCCDPWYRRSVRVSLGNVASVPWATTDRLPSTLPMLHSMQFCTYAMTPRGELDLRDVQRHPGDRVAIVLGAEGPGLRDETIAAARATVRIPMHAHADSLNVSVTAAVALYALGPQTLSS